MAFASSWHCDGVSRSGWGRSPSRCCPPSPSPCCPRSTPSSRSSSFLKCGRWTPVIWYSNFFDADNCHCTQLAPSLKMTNLAVLGSGCCSVAMVSRLGRQHLARSYSRTQVCWFLHPDCAPFHNQYKTVGDCPGIDGSGVTRRRVDGELSGRTEWRAQRRRRRKSVKAHGRRRWLCAAHV